MKVGKQQKSLRKRHLAKFRFTYSHVYIHAHLNSLAKPDLNEL